MNVEQPTTSKPEELLYFHNGETSSFAQALSKAGKGSFLIRSASCPGSYALLVNTGRVIQKFLIEVTAEGKYTLGPRTFDTIEDAIDRYYGRPIADNVCLERAVMCENQPSTSKLEVSSRYLGTDGTSGSSSDLNHNGLTTLDDKSTALHTFASIQAQRKSREEKQWKACFITLREDLNGNCELNISDSEHSTRPKLSFVLDSCQMYCIHRSVFGRDGCLYLGQHDADSYSTFLCIRPAHTYLAWVALLRPRVNWLRSTVITSAIPRALDTPRFSEITFFRVAIEKFVSDNMLRPDCLYSASVMVDGVRVFCSRAFTPISARNDNTMSIIFDANYVSYCAPVTPYTLQIVLCPATGGQSGSAFSKRASASSRTFFLQGDDDMHDTPENGFWVTVRRTAVHVLPASQYAPLLALVKQNNFELCEWVTSATEIAVRFFALDLVCKQDTRVEGVSNIYPEKPADVDLVADMFVRIAQEPAAWRILSLVAQVSLKYSSEDPYVTMRLISSLFILRFANPLLIQAQRAQTTNQLAKMVQAAANYASSPNLSEEDCSTAATTFRRFYEQTMASGVTSLIGVETEWSSDSMAVLAHLIASVVPTNSDLELQETNGETCPIALTPHVLRILRYHESGDG
ncbi:unnamed protein product, partial [Mesorhabditis spiculigera]